MKILPIERKSAVLTPSSLACLSDVATVNLTSGCAHGCIYCYTRGYSFHPGEGVIRLYSNTAAKLRTELQRKRRLPRAVYLSPSSDLFQPVPEVLDLSFETLSILFKAGVCVAFLTKGGIPPDHMRLLKANAPLVQAQIGLITLDEEVRRVFEPNTAPSMVRLAQARDLAAAGIATTGRIDPILPGITDDEETFRELCSAFSSAGISVVAASVLFLRTAITSSLRRRLRDGKLADRLWGAFAEKTRMAIHADNSSVTGLSTDARRKIFDRLGAIAHDHGIEIRLCACKNPDLASGSCRIAGSWPAAAQLDLFD